MGWRLLFDDGSILTVAIVVEANLLEVHGYDGALSRGSDDLFIARRKNVDRR